VREYRFSVADVWLMNAVEEGYRFEEGAKVPYEWLEEIVIWEGIWFLVPAMKLRVIDFGMSFLQGRHIGNTVIRLGLFPDLVISGDFAVTGVRDGVMQHTYRPDTVSLKFIGFGMPGVWLLPKATKGYGEKRASEVAQKFVKEEVFGKYSTLGGGAVLEYDVDVSYDSKVYLQGGRSGASFLSYLRDSALNRKGVQDYFTWFEVRNDGKLGYVFKFKSWEEMKAKPVKWRLEYLIDGGKWDKVWKNEGWLDKGVIPFMWYRVRDRNQVLEVPRRKFLKYSFDLKGLKVEKVLCDGVKELLGDKVKSNVIASVLEKDGVGELVVSGVKDIKNRTSPLQGFVQRCGNLRKMEVVVPGVRDIQLGDKVRVFMSSGYGGVQEAVSGDWIVGEKVHLWSINGRNYLLKLVLVSDVWKSEKKGV